MTVFVCSVHINAAISFMQDGLMFQNFIYVVIYVFIYVVAYVLLKGVIIS